MRACLAVRINLIWCAACSQVRISALKREEEALLKDKERLEVEKMHHLRCELPPPPLLLSLAAASFVRTSDCHRPPIYPVARLLRSAGARQKIDQSTSHYKSAVTALALLQGAQAAERQ